MIIRMNPRGAMSWAGLIVIATTIFGCPKPPVPPDPPPPPPIVDAGEDVDDPWMDSGPPTCETACEHMRKLKCKLGEDTQEGRKCEQVCEKAQTGTLELLRWDLPCLTTATACGMCK